MGAPKQEEQEHNDDQITLLHATEINATSSEDSNQSTALTDPDPLPDLKEVEEIIGYTFKNKVLLQQAFTHNSFLSTEFSPSSYERLEYAGDAVLNLLFSREHYNMYPVLPPGALTRIRAANVDTEKLARVAVKHKLHRYLHHKKPLLEEQIREFTRAISEYPLHSNGLIDAPKNLADIVESAIGAVFMDCNSLDIVWEVFKKLLEPLITPETMKMHPVSQLHEACQKKNLKLKFVDIWDKCKTVEVYINDQIVGTGSYSHKKEVAQNRAAKNAFDNIGKVLLADQEDNEAEANGVPVD